jgi:hypothetical protein
MSGAHHGAPSEPEEARRPPSQAHQSAPKVRVLRVSEAGGSPKKPLKIQKLLI